MPLFLHKLLSQRPRGGVMIKENYPETLVEEIVELGAIFAMDGGHLFLLTNTMATMMPTTLQAAC